MELIFLDDAFQVKSMPIDDFNSLQWRRRWRELGSFELHLDSKYFNAARGTAFLYQNEDRDTMRVLSIEYMDDKKELILSGQSLGSLFGDIVIPRTEILRGNLEECARRLVKKYAIEGDQKISKLELGTQHEYTAKVDTQITGETLSDALFALLSPEGMSWQLTYDFEADKILFEVLLGKDRTQDQKDNAWAFFSTSRENLLEVEYEKNQEDYKNFAYVAGAGEGEARTIVEVNQTGGARRRAIYVDARDLQREEGESEEEYKKRLIQRGQEKLKKRSLTETIAGVAAEDALPKLGIDYELGDKCDFEHTELGLSFSDIITGIDKVWEDGGHSTRPIFGAQSLNLRQIIEREVKR
ncbi:MAG: siphovirus ReqiPepy6 Gp37-like family protein [Clostridiales bacterium]|nr:siphovirus ReqiPepy6 Gp37-like family protein [Clostridiales bacterium]